MNGAENKVNKAKVIEYKISTWICYIIGVLIVFFFGIATFTLPYCILFVLYGLFMIWFGYGYKKKINTLNHYVSIIKNETSYSISDLAKETGHSEDVVKKNLNHFISSKLFKDTYIREYENMIYFGKPISRPTPRNTAHPIKMIAVECNGCGAPAKVQKGTVTTCEYCGTYIQG